MRQFYDFALRLYPAEYIALFGEGMRGILHEAAVEKRRQGTPFLGSVFARRWASIVGLGIEWMGEVKFNGYMFLPDGTRHRSSRL